jgi:antitoxin (DNA-binding transcriptional repressor) of toxin-antitoxin stability system
MVGSDRNAITSSGLAAAGLAPIDRLTRERSGAGATGNQYGRSQTQNDPAHPPAPIRIYFRQDIPSGSALYK